MSHFSQNMPDREHRSAVVFSHPGHELFVLGTLLRLPCDILYISTGFRAEPRLQQSLRRHLDYVGFQGDVTFLDVSEAEIFAHYLQKDFGWFAGLRDEVAHWLDRYRPTEIYTDAFEHYNSAHDLCPLVVDSALSKIESGWPASEPKRFEFPLAVYTLPYHEARRYRMAQRDWICETLRGERLNRKKIAWSLVAEETARSGLQFKDGPTEMTLDWPPERYAEEYYRGVLQGRNYALPPKQISWVNYDQRGFARVREGRALQAITFAKHYLPIARALADENTSLQSESRRIG